MGAGVFNGFNLAGSSASTRVVTFAVSRAGWLLVVAKKVAIDCGLKARLIEGLFRPSFRLWRALGLVFITRGDAPASVENSRARNPWKTLFDFVTFFRRSAQSGHRCSVQRPVVWAPSGPCVVCHTTAA